MYTPILQYKGVYITRTFYHYEIPVRYESGVCVCVYVTKAYWTYPVSGCNLIEPRLIPTVAETCQIGDA